MDISAINRHDNIVFQFSGGKDSIACLILLRKYLHKITVLWTNSGACLPETLRQMEKVKEICPNFIEVNGNQPEQIRCFGYPTDVLPIRNQHHIQFLAQQKRPLLQSFYDCCFNSIMKPMHDATLKLGATLVIRGQKLADNEKSPARSGDVFNGIEFLFPIEDWTDDEVYDFIDGSGFEHELFERGQTSLDCWNCTAYADNFHWRLPYMRAHHPEKYEELVRRIEAVKKEINCDLRHMEV